MPAGAGAGARGGAAAPGGHWIGAFGIERLAIAVTRPEGCGHGQSLEEAAAPARAQRWQRDLGTVALAHPALVGGAGCAQLADDQALAGGEEHVGLLAAQQAPLAHVAGHVGL
jgi:hypothetical protein